MQQSGNVRSSPGRAQLVVVTLVLLLPSLAACARNKAADFAAVNAVVARVDPAGLGTVVSDVKSGSGRALGQQPRRTVDVAIAGDAAAALQKVSASVVQAGGVPEGTNHWQFHGTKLIGLSATVVGTQDAQGRTTVSLDFDQSS